MNGVPTRQYIYTYMTSSAGRSGRVRKLKLGHGADPRRRMTDYTKQHSRDTYHVSIALSRVSRIRHEEKPIKASLRQWKVSLSSSQAKSVELEIAWYLHEKLNLENHYLFVLRQHLDGQLPSIYKTTENGELIWSGSKELHMLGPVYLDRTDPDRGPKAKYQKATEAISRILKEKGVLSV